MKVEADDANLSADKMKPAYDKSDNKHRQRSIEDVTRSPRSKTPS